MIGERMKREEHRSKLLGVSEAAERLGVRPATIRSWILKREKLEIVKVGRLVRITERSIDQFIDENTIPPHRSL
jgi:excisionase family DNA binding protein